MTEKDKGSRLLAGLFAVGLMLAGQGLFAAPAVYEAAGLNVAPGSTASQLGFTWASTASIKKPVVQIVKASDMRGDSFPAAKATSFKGIETPMTATEFTGEDKTLATGSYAEKVTATGLAASTDYLYRVGDGRAWSAAYPISTRDAKDFGFLVVGDPQLGSKATGPKTLEADKAGWADTLAKATGAFPDSSFLLSLGDEVNDYNKRSTQDAEYEAFFSPAQLRSLPLATVNGNHDFQMGEYYGYHYNQPNLSALYGSSYGNDGDYWFSYGDALFLMLNSNTESVATHDVFIRDAVAKNPSAKWRIACFHHSLFSEAEHLSDAEIVDRRMNYPSVLERYKIDVVLQGHDHSYTRTYPLLKGKPVQSDVPDANGALVNPKGIVYFTFNSGSGSKFYDWKDAAPEVYSAARWQGKVPSFSYVTIGSDTITVTTYRTDDMSIIDNCSIVKTK